MNGKLVNEERNVSINYQYALLHYVNIGSGYISGSGDGKPTKDFAGWYPFTGLVEDLRIWLGSCLDDQQIRALSEHDPEILERVLDSADFSMQRHLSTYPDAAVGVLNMNQARPSGDTQSAKHK